MLSFSHFLALLSMVLTITSVTAFATPAPPLQQGPITAPTTNSTIYTEDAGLTVGLPLGWVAVDANNTSTEATQIAASQFKETLVEFCPHVQSILNSSDGIITCDEHSAVNRVSRYVNMDKNPDFARGAASVDPSSGLIVMNLTAHDFADFQDRSSPNMNIVQTKDALVNFSSNTNNGGAAQWRIPGKLVLAANQINQLGWIQLLYVDWTSGYEVSYMARKRGEGSREPISLLGTSLDSLPQELQPMIQIMTSLNLQRPASR